MENNPAYYLVELSREIVRSTNDVDVLKEVASSLADNLELAATAYDTLMLKEKMKESLNEKLKDYSVN